MMEQTPRTGFNILLMIEAIIAICVVLAGVVWAWSSVERRVTALEEERHREAQSRDVKERDARIDRIEKSMQDQSKLIEQLIRTK
jgi:small-conductance mechanosensitive channel